ncbi:DUF6230 family protein [Saccharothrix xinjiangensis]|uniref:DUF6230 family protein n=1 Tax=Saccharothrix xinjiangensis TaxID=204798 RepID=A0ABV9Y2H7_9PSEU
MSRGRGGGRTSWVRFAAVFVAGSLAAAAVLTGVARGALAASFTVAGTSFKTTADKLEGEGFVQFGGVVQGSGDAHPVAVSGFRSAVLDNFCQSVLLRSMPVVGDITLRLTSPGPGGMAATNMIIDVAELSGDLTLVNAEIGIDAAAAGKGPDELRGPPGAYAQQADRATAVGLRQTAWSTTAHTLRLKNLHLALRSGAAECY